MFAVTIAVPLRVDGVLVRVVVKLERLMRVGVVVGAVNAVVFSVEAVICARAPLVVDVNQLFAGFIALERLILSAGENVGVRELVAVV